MSQSSGKAQAKPIDIEFGPNHRTEVGMVQLNKTIIDPRVQRDVVDSEVAAIVAKFKASLLNFVTISVRANGDFILLDGLQRKTACGIIGYEEPVNCIYHHGLTLEEEALLFQGLNFRTPVNARDHFKVSLTAQDPAALAIKSVLDKFAVRYLGKSAQFQAYGMALRVVSLPGGVENLTWALAMYTSAWELMNKVAIDGRVTEALAMIHRAYRDDPNFKADLIRNTLSTYSNGVKSIIGDANGARLLRQDGKISELMASVIISKYNKTKPKNKLPDWNFNKK